MSNFSGQRLERMHRILSGHIRRGEIPGLVAMLSKGNETHVEVLGMSSLSDSSTMKRNSIFRIASLSKPIAAVAAMILIEECKMRLDDSIEKWIPELANRKVLKSMESELDDTVPAERAISVRDLLTFRMGFGSVMAEPDRYPIQKAIRELAIGGDGPPLPDKGPNTEDWLRNLSSLPWMAQPGTKWMYHVSGDVLGVLISRVSGQSLGGFLQERIFDPLAMKDSGFWVPQDKLDRFLPAYRLNGETHSFEEFDGVQNSAWGTPPPFESAGGGLVGTADDYFTFCRMILRHGRYEGKEILSRASTELITSDHLTADQRKDAEIFFGTTSSWGFGGAVDIAKGEIYQTPGKYGWLGGLGTAAFVNPKEDSVDLIFTNRILDSPQPPGVFSDFWTLAYGAML